MLRYIVCTGYIIKLRMIGLISAQHLAVDTHILHEHCDNIYDDLYERDDIHSSSTAVYSCVACAWLLTVAQRYKQYSVSDNISNAMHQRLMIREERLCDSSYATQC
jgi:hypothetical protein